jgi:hypothetical protein
LLCCAGPDFELDVALVKAAREGLGPDIKVPS